MPRSVPSHTPHSPPDTRRRSMPLQLQARVLPTFPECNTDDEAHELPGRYEDTTEERCYYITAPLMPRRRLLSARRALHQPADVLATNQTFQMPPRRSAAISSLHTSPRLTCAIARISCSLRRDCVRSLPSRCFAQDEILESFLIHRRPHAALIIVIPCLNLPCRANHSRPYAESYYARDADGFRFVD
jgi:hypothetical protein